MKNVYFGQPAEYGIFGVVAKELLRSPATLEHDVRGLSLERFHGLRTPQVHRPIEYSGPRGEVPGSQYRPRQAEVLASAPHTQQELEEMRRNRDDIQAEMDRMPGGAPQTIEDMERLLPNINFLGDQTNCVEVSMAVDDIQAGHAAVAGRSRGYASGWMGADARPNPAAIEQEMLQSDNAQGIVSIVKPEIGQGHFLNVRNFGGKVWWIDGQARWWPNGQVNGGEYTGITDHFPYPGDFEFHLIRHVGSEAQ
jgi:hypothetical protein